MYPYGSPCLPMYYQEPNQSYRTEVLKWYGNLEASEQHMIFQIKSCNKTFPILQMYIYDRHFVQSHYALRHQQINLQQRFDDQFIATSKMLHPRAEEFYDLLRITDDSEFLDTIYTEIEDQKKFFELLFEVSNNQFLSRPPKVSQQRVEDPDWFNQKSFRSCIEWIVREFEKNIAFYFMTEKKKKSKNHQQTTIKNNNNELQKFFSANLSNNKEKLLKFYAQIQNDMSKKPESLENIFYNNIFQSPAIKALKSSTEIQQSFLLKCHQDRNIIQSMLVIKMSDLVEQNTYLLKKFYPIVLNLYQEYLEYELIQSEENSKSKQKNKKKKKKKLIKQEIESPTKIVSIEQKNSPETQNVTIEKPLILIEMNEISKIEQIAPQIENIMETYQQSKYQAEVQLISEAEELIMKIIQDSQIYLQEEEIFLKEQKKKKQNGKRLKQEMKKSESSNAVQHLETQLLLEQQSTLQKKQSIQQEDELIEQVQSQEEQDCSQSTEGSINSHLQKQNNSESMKIIIDSDHSLGREKMLEFITLDIINFTDQILNDFDQMLPFRMIAFNRIKYVVQSLFFLADDKIKLFGSCATGLALLDSDIDIGISSFEALDKFSLRQPFNQLYYTFSQKKWVTKSKSIFNTMVPVIKLEIDPLIFFEDFTQTFLNVNEVQAQQWLMLRRQLKSGIKVDISFSYSESHLGYESTEMVRKWMQEFPSIQQIVLLVKTIIKKIGCSESYQGGLSSFSIIVMVYCYFRENRVKSESIGEQFLDLIHFYTNEFNPSTIGIGLLNQNHFIKPNEPSYFFPLKDLCLPKMPITIFSPLNGRLISGSCSLFDKIIKNFRIILDNSQQQQEFFNQFVTYGKKKQQKLSKDIINFISQILMAIN